MQSENTIEVLIGNIEKVITGKREVIKLLLAGLLSRGHILIEDVPGLGKTMLVRALAKSINADFKRVQFTPDLLPSDITGVSIYNQGTSKFEFKQGPIFANIILADEINRTTPRTQSGLLECMQEYSITVDGITHKLPDPFFVIATQNPIEFYGTYPLPEAQLDRFLMRFNMGYVLENEEINILENRLTKDPIDTLKSVLPISDILSVMNKVDNIHINKDLLTYIVRIINATRQHPDIKLGASPRGSLSIMRLSKAYALLNSRDYVVPSDIKDITIPSLNHRIILYPASLVKGIKPQEVIQDILNKVPVPV
ncbi:MAG: MoxR family ATPase [Candidatus Omnitrophica bacterium]|nr:MoxR family ATPase [Candidatus Omnitrophota bacterium]MBU1872044.1 MoxR family ATPase [Candidatus Omnitrophota bacterium]